MTTINAFTSDEDAIRKWMSDYTDAWNKHDARALALLFREDADFVGGSGGVFRGRSQIERLMTEEFSTSLKEWKLTNAIEDIRFIKPDIAIVNGTYEATGIGSNAQAAPLKGLYTVIMGKERRKWVALGARSIVR
ncbi:MAG: SgcJ/EcaC family oxidoreductase [Blastocatellia bacterium]